MKYPNDIALLISEGWKPLSPESKYKPSQCLPLTALTTLLETCFFASLKREEDRAIQFDVALCPPSALEKAPFRFSKFTKTFNLMSFAKPLELSVSRLLRIAPACNPDKTLILVKYDETTGQLQLWGVVDVGWQSGIVSMALTELRVRAFSPGELEISLFAQRLCRFKDGHIELPEKGLVNSGCIYAFFRDTSLLLAEEVSDTGDFPIFELTPNERDYRAMGYLSVLKDVIGRMQRLKHGGCIFVVPEDESLNLGVNVDIKYECRNDAIWHCLKGHWILHDRYFRSLEAAKKKPGDPQEIASIQSEQADVEKGLRDSLDTLVRFTAVDGAVIITRKFEILGFGAVVQLPQTTGYKVFKSLDRRGEHLEEEEITRYGTRHRSAFEFCYKHTPSVAFIVSQDGGVKTVTRVGEHICFWETSIFDIQEL